MAITLIEKEQEETGRKGKNRVKWPYKALLNEVVNMEKSLYTSLADSMYNLYV